MIVEIDWKVPGELPICRVSVASAALAACRSRRSRWRCAGCSRPPLRNVVAAVAFASDRDAYRLTAWTSSGSVWVATA